MTEKPYFRIQAQANDSADIFIYDQIGENWFGEGITAKRFCQELRDLKVSAINLHISSPGGSVFDGQDIYNALKVHPASITVYIGSLAASIASVIALAGDKIVMASNGLYMIHNPWGSVQGEAADMRKYAGVLDKVKETIIAVYKEKCNLNGAEIVAAMDAETWMTADEALAFGFIDEIGLAPTETAPTALSRFDFKALGFKYPPQAATVTVEVEIDTADTSSLVESTTEPACYCTGCAPEMACVDCTQSDTCINPKQTSMAQAVTTPTAPKAVIREVTTMENVTVVTPATGERTEAAAIVTICNIHGFSDKAAGFIEAGMNMDQVSAKILEMKTSAPIPFNNPQKVEKTKEEYSFKNAIAANVAMKEGRPVSCLETEMHQDLLKTMPANFQSQGGIIVPLNTSLTTGGAGTGAEVVQTQYGSLIEMLRNISVTSKLGATFMTGLTGPLTFPKQTSASTLVWTGEAPASGVTESNIGLTTVTLSPKTARSTGSISRNLLVQSTPAAEGLVRNDLASIAALGIDLAALHGTGDNNQPTGLYVAANVNAVAMGGVPTYANLVKMATECATDNALFGNLGFAANPQMAGKLMATLVASSAGSKMIWDGNHLDGAVAGYKAISSNQVSKTLGGGAEQGILFGNWSELLIGQWAGIEIVTDPYTLLDRGLIRLVLNLIVDVQIRHPEAFCKATGATL